MSQEAEIVHVTRVFKKDGEKNGRKWEQLGIQVSEHGERWMSMFIDDKNKKVADAIKEGDEIKIFVEEKQVGDRTFYNFRLPSVIDIMFEKMHKLEARVEVLEKGGVARSEPGELPDIDAPEGW